MGIKATIRPEVLISGQRGGKHIYLVAGRVPNDDDDTVCLVQAEDEAGARALLEEVVVDEAGYIGIEWDQIVMSHGVRVIHTQCYAVADLEDED